VGEGIEMTEHTLREGDLLSRHVNRRQLIVGLVTSIAASGLTLAACSQPAAPTPTAAKPAATTASGSAPAAAATPATKAPGVPAGTKITMTVRAVFVPAANDLLTAQAKKWAEVNKAEATVEVVSLNDLQAKGATAAETGAGPDIMQLWVNAPHQFSEKLIDLTSVAETLGSKYGGWYDVAKEGVVVNGQWKAIPQFFSAHAMNYREDFFKAAGIDKNPETWDQFLEVGKKLKAAKQPPIGLALGHAVGDGNNFLYSLLWSFGGAETDKDGKTVTINSSETLKAVEFVKALYSEAMTPDVTSWDDSSNNRAFTAGQVSATNNAASIYAVVQKDAPDVYANMNHFAYPAGPAGKAQYAEMHSLGVMSYSKNQEAAKDLIAYLMDEAQYAPWLAMGATAAMPLLKSFESKSDAPWNKDPKLASFKGLGAIGRLPGWRGPSSARAAEAFAKFIIIDMFAQAATGKMAPADAVKWAENELKQIYGI
jgi:multiple sugar transport system substrate-binding protein